MARKKKRRKTSRKRVAKRRRKHMVLSFSYRLGRWVRTTRRQTAAQRARAIKRWAKIREERRHGKRRPKRKRTAAERRARRRAAITRYRARMRKHGRTLKKRYVDRKRLGWQPPRRHHVAIVYYNPSHPHARRILRVHGTTSQINAALLRLHAAGFSAYFNSAML